MRRCLVYTISFINDTLDKSPRSQNLLHSLYSLNMELVVTATAPSCPQGSNPTDNVGVTTMEMAFEKQERDI
jgi:hypothetical protein